MRALLTGATGFLGSHLARRLVLDGHDVEIIARQSSDLHILGNIRDSIKIHLINDKITTDKMDFIGTSLPNVVFHLATYFIAQHSTEDISPLIQSNVLFPCQLVDSMVRHGVKRLVNCSSAWQHYNNAAYNPTCLYAATKEAFLTLVQFYVAAEGLSVLDLTISDTYGPEDRRPKLFPTLYRAAETQQTLAFSSGHQVLDLVYIDDVTNALCTAASRLMQMEDGRIENHRIMSHKPASLREIVDIFCRVTGLSPQIAWGARPYRQREMMAPWTGGTTLPAWRPLVGIEEGILRMHSHYVLNTRN